MDGLVGVVELLPAGDGSNLFEFDNGLVHQDLFNASLKKPRSEKFEFDVAVVLPRLPVPQIAIAEFLLKDSSTACWLLISPRPTFAMSVALLGNRQSGPSGRTRLPIPQEGN